MDSRKPNAFGGLVSWLNGEDSEQQPIRVAMDIPPQVGPQPSLSQPTRQLASAKLTPTLPPAPQKAYGFGAGLDDAALKSAQADAAQQRYLAMMGDAASVLGAGMSGRKADHSFYQNLAANADQGVRDLQERRRAFVEDTKMAQAQASQDPESDKSKGKRELYRKLFPDIAKSIPHFDKLSAEDIEELKSPIELAQRAKDRVLQIQMMKDEKKAAKEEKRAQDLEERTTIYGVARTKDDAKQLKEAAELKSKMDRQLEELIKLRREYGVEYANRDAVARGKQLSKDLLLTYKDMAKLGVLSQSDEHILNQIIPPDPLGQDWSPFGDSIMSNLEKFRGDVNADFNTRLYNRLKDPAQAPEPQQKTPALKVDQNAIDAELKRRRK